MISKNVLNVDMFGILLFLELIDLVKIVFIVCVVLIVVVVLEGFLIMINMIFVIIM